MNYILTILFAISFQALSCLPPISIGLSEFQIEVPDPLFSDKANIQDSEGRVTATVFFDAQGHVVKLKNLKTFPATLPKEPVIRALNSARRLYSAAKATSHDVDLVFPIKFKEKMRLQLNLTPPIL
ncbi:hypothetical protein [Pseudoalteromonas rubra]|uniref:TonB C-terminal domain-containing protein n=1 Tax=Pseudoalteromonas rubra TaxID=43658 RepID=A0A0U3I5K2_9GAMM|nr:hypothetical protein [Pseudoalteromonas rubra]ALU42359.1 hypothetical protein AT705_05000 [Pseudoalteromonas rubra]